jgi:4-hydroxybenzoate polyprenyltransferase
MVPLWTMHLLGAVHATGRVLFVPAGVWFVLSAAHTSLMGAVYILNQLTDVRTDAANSKLFLLAGGYVRRRFAFGEMALLTVLAVVPVGVGVLTGWLRVEVAALFFASGVLGVAYSVPPFRLKARAGWDIVANTVGYGVVAFAVGWIAVEPVSGRTWQLSVPYAFSVAAAFAFTTIPDIPGDCAAGDRTLGVQLGARATSWVGVGCLVAGCFSALAVRNYVSLTALGPSVAVYLWAMRRMSRHGEVSSLLRVTQYVILWLSLVAVVGAPVYGLWLVVVVVWTRWYYRRRFGIRYP